MICRYCGRRIVKILVGWKHDGLPTWSDSLHIPRPKRGSG